MEIEASLAKRRKITKLFSIFTSTPLTGTLKTYFELNPTLKTFDISIGKQYFYSIYILENLMSSLVIVMQVSNAMQIRNAP